jgi:hypothetical protein
MRLRISVGRANSLELKVLGVSSSKTSRSLNSWLWRCMYNSSRLPLDAIDRFLLPDPRETFAIVPQTEAKTNVMGPVM